MTAKLHRTPALLTNPLTAEQVCKLLGVSRTTLHRMKEDGAFPPHYNMGGRQWFEESEVRAFFMALRVEPTAPIEQIRAAFARNSVSQKNNPFRQRK